MVRRLVVRQPGDRRQDAECIGCQQDDVAGLAGDPGRVGVADEIERIGGPGVLGDPVGVQVELPGYRVELDVLQDRPEPLRRLEDVRLVHRAEADRLRVAAALEVEDAVVAPAVLVIADEAPFGIGRERRLARARQSEEDNGVARGADVHRRVHRQDALVGHQVVHDSEGRLLDLAGVFGADDDDLHPAEVDEDRGLAPGAVCRRVGLERRHIDDREVGPECGQILSRGAAEEVAREDAGPRGLGVDPQRAAVIRVGPDEAVLGEEVSPRDVVDKPRPQHIVMLFGDRLVDLAPPDLVLG